jgi:uncharacterized protein YbjT (DUF2867 family)
MSQHPVIAITGATGNIGRAVTEHLHARGARLRLVVRDPRRAPAGASDVVRATYDDRDAAIAALRGADLLLMVSASESADRLDEHRTFVDAAADAGVGHVVYTSFIGAAPQATFTLARDHAATEEHLRASGMAWTFLRDSLYLDFLPELAGDDGVIRGPAGQGRVGAVARADVARCAAAVLVSPGTHAGRTYDLTGPEALTLAEVARTLTDVTGRATTYEEETVAQAYASRQHLGAPAWQLDAWVSTYTAIAAGELAQVTDAVEQLTGTPPTRLADLLRGV